MAVRAYFNLDNNALDTSGNGLHGTIVGAGPTFEVDEPVALIGTHCAVDFTDANYITLPPTIFTPMEYVGAFQYSLYYREGDVAGNRLPYRSKHGGAGDFYIEWAAAMTMLYPTSTGVKVAVSGALTKKNGRWYTVLVSWNATGLDVWVIDQVTGETQHPFDLHPLPGGAVPKFSVGTNVWLGRSDIAGFSYQGALDNVAFYDEAITTPPQTIPTRRLIYTFGHSWVRGLGSTTGDGYRKQCFFDLAAAGDRTDFYGTYTDGTEIPCPYTNGESGHTSAQVLADLNLRLPQVMYAADTKSILILGPTSLTDLIVGGISAAQHQQNIKDCLAAIHAYAPGVKIFVVTQNPDILHGTAQDYIDFAAADAAAVVWGKAQGYWVELIAAYGNISVEISGDQIHPNDAGYVTLGAYIAARVSEKLVPTISGVASSSVGATSAVVSWTTDIPADSQVEYGLTPSYGTLTTLDPVVTTSHSQTLTGLTPGETYHYRVRSTGSGTGVSTDYTFTTSLSENKYKQMLLNLFPRGAAWSKVGGGLPDLCNGMSQELLTADEAILSLVTERDSRTASLLLPEHEADLGISPPSGATDAERRSIVRSVLTAMGGVNPQYYIDLALAMGYVITIDEFRPAWCGVLVCGEPCGGQEVIFVWRVNLQYSPTTPDPTGAELLEVLERLKPAHTEILFRIVAVDFNGDFSSADFNALPPSGTAGDFSRFDFDSADFYVGLAGDFSRLDFDRDDFKIGGL